ncbi:hypothetical protein KF913_13525 [Candidatus Obscuribacterales bacterium]|nr:hypothetical protein [Candidatus Obscuribacterales bacterium]
MILTKKGSTRGTVSILLMAAMILLGTRFLVSYIEENFPASNVSTIEWKSVPDVLKRNEKALDEETAIEVNTGADASSGAGGDAGGGATSAKTGSNSRGHTETVAANGFKPVDKNGSVRAEKKTKKRFAVERLFPDNVDQKPIFFFFADEGSILSQRMQKRTLSIPDIRNKINREFYPVKINFDKPLTKTEYKLYHQYASAAAPAIAIRSATGDNLAYNVGYLSGVKTVILLQNAMNVQKKLDEGGEAEPEL